jgi:hypothetical protein
MKRLNNQNNDRDVLKQIIQVNNLEWIDVKDAWKNLRAGVNSYTNNVLGSTLYVELIFVCGKEIKPMEVKKSSDDQ